MANHTGVDGVVKVGTNTVAEVRNWSVSESADTIEDTTINDTSRTYQAGLKSWSGSLTAFWDETDTNGQVALTVNPHNGRFELVALGGSQRLEQDGKCLAIDLDFRFDGLGRKRGLELCKRLDFHIGSEKMAPRRGPRITTGWSGSAHQTP